MSNNLSIVNIIHVDFKDLINELAFELGMGENSLSIPLTNQYFACHSWWSQEKYSIFKDLSALRSIGIDVDKYLPALNALHEFVIDTEGMAPEQVNDVPAQNTNNAYNALGLTPVLDSDTQE